MDVLSSQSLDQGVFASLVGEPLSGVMLVTLDARLLYANDQAARMFSTSSMTGTQWVALDVLRPGFMPDGWRDDVADLGRRVLAGDNKVVLRTIWQGAQIFTWPTLLNAMPFMPGVLPQSSTWRTPEPTGPVLMLTSRRVGRSCAAEIYADSSLKVMQSRVADLGKVKVLTERELQVLAILGDGGTLRAAAHRLHRSEKTIDAHRSAIHTKLGITDRLQLAFISQTLGLTLEDVDRFVVTGALK